MLNPDDQPKETATVETNENERATNQTKGDRPRSTADLAKDLDRREAEEHTDGTARLFPEKEMSDFRSHWTDIQTRFVDEPRRSVEEADALVAEVTKRLADSFANERSKLEGQWGRGDNVSTEDLRLALQRYRAFFDRLLKV